MSVPRSLRFVALLCGIGAGLGVPRASAGQRTAPGSGMRLPAIEWAEEGRVARLERWLKLTARHAPGEDDEALEDIAGWPDAQLKQLWIDTNVLAQIMRNVRADPKIFTVRSAAKSSAQVRYTETQLHRLHVLACAASGLLVEPECMAQQAGDPLGPELQQIAVLARASSLRGDRNYILRRGALLHSDVPVLAPMSMTAPADSQASAVGPERFRMEISDGQEIDLRQSAVHWELARMLLDFVIPRGGNRAGPAGDDMVRLWYRATAAWMQLREDHDKSHLDRARELFPPDPDILFLSGCQRETFAGTPIQTAVRSAVLPTGVTLDVRSERTELREAETFFRRALEITPEYAEARLHLGRVIALLGRHGEAAVELRRAVDELTEDEQIYYAALFLGAEEEALANREPARAAYERAAALAPKAQSPLLALSQLARRYGDRPEALRAIERLFSLPEEDRDENDDPLWWYYVTQGRHADDWLEAMRQPYLAERLP